MGKRKEIAQKLMEEFIQSSDLTFGDILEGREIYVLERHLLLHPHNITIAKVEH